MGRPRKFTPEFKLEAVKLVLERGITAAQAARDLENVMRKWVKDARDHGARRFRDKVAAELLASAMRAKYNLET